MDSLKFPRRKFARLRSFDYGSPGAYFITICTHHRECLLSKIDDDLVTLSDLGEIVRQCWHTIPARFPHVAIDEFIVMPNHVHGVLFLQTAGAMNRAPTLGEIIRAFKAQATLEIRRRLGFSSPLWQRNYHEHVIRKDEDMNRIRQYIIDNPKNWETDKENPHCSSS